MNTFSSKRRPGCKDVIGPRIVINFLGLHIRELLVEGRQSVVVGEQSVVVELGKVLASSVRSTTR